MHQTLGAHVSSNRKCQVANNLVGRWCSKSKHTELDLYFGIT
jgi:hypothetical protein